MELLDFMDLQQYIDDAEGPTVFVVSAAVPLLPATTQVLIRKPSIIITSSLEHLTGSGGSTPGSGPTLSLACDQAPGPLIQIRWVNHSTRAISSSSITRAISSSSSSGTGQNLFCCTN